MTVITPDAPILGIDIGGTKIAFAIGSADGRLWATHRRPTEPTGEPDRDLARLVDDARALMRQAGIEPAELAAVGVSAPGPLDVEGGRLMGPPNLPGWIDTPLRDPLAEALGGPPTYLENDANAAALAEWRHGAGQGARDLVYLTMSTGVGGGLVVGGRIHRGLASGAGEVGHMPIEWDGEPCPCGLRGCLETYVGGAAWIRRLQRETPADSAVARLAGSVAAARPEHVVEAARAGDAFALAEMERFNDYLSRALVTLAFVLAPQVIVLGTIASAAGDALCLDPVRRRVREHTWPGVGRRIQIRAAALGPELPYRAGLCAAIAGAEMERQRPMEADASGSKGRD